MYCTDPLRHRAHDFLQHVDSKILVPHIFAKNLITADDLERVQLPTMTSSDKVNFLYLKLLHLGKEGFETFMNCLKDANEHPEHDELYDKLSSALQ